MRIFNRPIRICKEGCFIKSWIGRSKKYKNRFENFRIRDSKTLKKKKRDIVIYIWKKEEQTKGSDIQMNQDFFYKHWMNISIIYLFVLLWSKLTRTNSMYHILIKLISIKHWQLGFFKKSIYFTGENFDCKNQYCSFSLAYIKIQIMVGHEQLDRFVNVCLLIIIKWWSFKILKHNIIALEIHDRLLYCFAIK